MGIRPQLTISELFMEAVASSERWQCFGEEVLCSRDGFMRCLEEKPTGVFDELHVIERKGINDDSKYLTQVATSFFMSFNGKRDGFGFGSKIISSSWHIKF